MCWRLCLLDKQEWATPLVLSRVFCEFVVSVWARKVQYIVRCVASFMARNLYTWTALRLFCNSFCRVSLLIKYLNDDHFYLCFVLCCYLTFVFTLTFCGLLLSIRYGSSRIKDRVISGLVLHCWIVCALCFTDS
jgi:hypothetical protein